MNSKTEINKRRSNLSAAKRAILEKRLQKEHRSDTKQIVISRRTQQSPIPLSSSQQQIWFLQQLEPLSSVYNEFACIQLKGTLNLVAFEKSFNEIIIRHESLRTSFEILDQQPVQVIHPTLSIELPVVNLSDLPQALQDAEIERLNAEIACKPFDLTSTPLLRVMLLQTSEQEYLLLLVVHHIVCDVWSIQVLNKELAAIYEAFSVEQSSPLAELPVQYADYTIWQHKWLQSEREKSLLSYWQQQLKNAPITLSLPTDYQRPPVQSFKGAANFFKLSTHLSNRLRAFSNKQGVTLFMTLLAAFQAQLYRYTSQEDLCVGSPIANRNYAEIEGLIGFFVNTLVLRTHLSGDLSFLELLDRVREVCVGAYAHADIPFEQLVGELHSERNLSHTPLFQVTFALHEDTKKDLLLPDLTLQWLQKHNGTAKFDLTLYVVDSKPELSGWWEYNTDLFNATTIERMVEHFTNLLEGIVGNPQQRLSELPLLNESEQYQLLREWNDTTTDYPKDKCIHELFEAQVEKTPDAIAVVFEDQQLTYQELNAKTNQLAYYLRSLGVKPEVLVGICVERSLDMVIGLLAILKAGGAYVPLDPNYPKERLKFILEDTKAAVLLTKASLLESIPQDKTAIICLDDDSEEIAQRSQENLPSQLNTDNLAYTIYTSGSTGKPKGVQIPHSALSNFLYSMRQAPGLTSGDTLLAVTTYSFDIAALELFLPIIVGARLVVANQEIVSDGIGLSAKLIDSKATFMQATPATWQLLLAAGWDGNPRLKILCGGEALPRYLANELLGRCNSLWNMYGPTETTIWSAASQITTDSKVIPISHPIANTQLYILDKYNQLVPVGVAGELCIGGEGIARGYFHRADLSAEKFIPNPFSTQATRLYKTGDLARYLPSGEIEYIGRIDNQVKVRGFRIELGEIETAISQYPGVQETVAVVREDSADSQRIVAYIVAQQEATLTISELRNFLKSKLPNYMLPTAFVTLEALPLTPNGKVDRKALPAPDTARPAQLDKELLAPRNSVEAKLTEIGKEVLELDKLGIFDNFFELGGDSILATIFITRANRSGLQLSVKHLFQHQTVADLAAVAVTKKVNQTEQKNTTANTPSNFPKANLNQQDLNRFLAKVKRGSKSKTK